MDTKEYEKGFGTIAIEKRFITEHRHHLEFFKFLPFYIELEDYYVVHAGFRPEVPVKDQSPEDMLWIREEFHYSGYDFGKKLFLDIASSKGLLF